MLRTVGQGVWLILPAYLANMAPLVARLAMKGRCAWPIDFDRTWSGKPVLGPHKTLRGVVAGVVTAVVTSVAQAKVADLPFVQPLNLVPFDHVPPVLWGLLLGVGALVGDAIKSLIKRRRGIPPGYSWKPFDQLDFLVGALAAGSIAYAPPWRVVVAILVVMPFVKVLVATVGHAVGLRPTRW